MKYLKALNDVDHVELEAGGELFTESSHCLYIMREGERANILSGSGGTSGGEGIGRTSLSIRSLSSVGWTSPSAGWVSSFGSAEAAGSAGGTTVLSVREGAVKMVEVRRVELDENEVFSKEGVVGTAEGAGGREEGGGTGEEETSEKSMEKRLSTSTLLGGGTASGAAGARTGAEAPRAGSVETSAVWFMSPVRCTMVGG